MKMAWNVGSFDAVQRGLRASAESLGKVKADLGTIESQSRSLKEFAQRVDELEALVCQYQAYLAKDCEKLAQAGALIVDVDKARARYFLP